MEMKLDSKSTRSIISVASYF